MATGLTQPFHGGGTPQCVHQVDFGLAFAQSIGHSADLPKVFAESVHQRSFGVFLKKEITYLAVVFHCASCSDGRWAVDWAVDLPCAFVDVG